MNAVLTFEMIEASIERACTMRVHPAYYQDMLDIQKKRFEFISESRIYWDQEEQRFKPVTKYRNWERN